MQTEMIRRTLLPQLPVVLQTAIAAVAAWYLAVALLPNPAPAFASIAAVICLGATYGHRRRQAVELVGGVMVGLTVATILLALIGIGPWQIALLIGLAMSAALLLRGGPTLVNEAAVSAILLASIQQADPGFSTDRILEGLIGGGVGLAIASLLLPPDPVLMVNRAAQSVVGKLGHTLQETAGALEAGDTGRAEQALQRRARDRRGHRGARGEHPGGQRDRALLARPPRRPRGAAPLRGHAAAGRLRRPQRARAHPLRPAPHAQRRAGARRAAARRARARRRRLGARRTVRPAGAPDRAAPARAQRRPPRRARARVRRS